MREYLAAAARTFDRHAAAISALSAAVSINRAAECAAHSTAAAHASAAHSAAAHAAAAHSSAHSTAHPHPHSAHAVVEHIFKRQLLVA